MLSIENVKDSINNVIQLCGNRNQDEPYVVGHGILPGLYFFNETKLEESKQTIATILQELGIDENTKISLSNLVTLKNGKIWNNLQSLDDFMALELFLACSDACGFIHNDIKNIQENINEIGGINSDSNQILEWGRLLLGNDKWLQYIRETIISKMHFQTNPESIKLAAKSNQNLAKVLVNDLN